MADQIRWGIIGTGSICTSFAEALAMVPEAKLMAVGSRSKEKSKEFGEKFNIPHRHGTYEALVSDPEVDAVYVGTPHTFHMENTILALKAGKHVLCEKPFCINATQAAKMIKLARDKKLFLMEAMWTRFFPVMSKVREWLRAGHIGEPRLVAADFGFRAGFDPKTRIFDPALGGGALLDVGVYAISFASMALGGAVGRIASMANLGKSGVDEESAFILGFPGGKLAVLYSAVRLTTPWNGLILGTEGKIEIESPFWCPKVAKLEAGQTKIKFENDYQGRGDQFMAAEVTRCLRDGKLESDIMPLDESLAIMKTMDKIREQWKLKYPMEK